MAIGISSAPDPFNTNLTAYNLGYKDLSGKTVSSFTQSATKIVVITLGQSLYTSAATGTYTIVNPTHVFNFNIWDGAVYVATNPVLGPPRSVLGDNSPNVSIADMLVSSGDYTDVMIVPIATGGSFSSDWILGGYAYDLVTCAMNRLAARGYTPSVISWHQGQADTALGAGTPGATYTSRVQSVCQHFRDLGATCPFLVGLDTMVSGTPDSTIRTAQANCVSAPLNIVQGADWDTISTLYRQDGTHFTDVGAASAATLEVSAIRNAI